MAGSENKDRRNDIGNIKQKLLQITKQKLLQLTKQKQRGALNVLNKLDPKLRKPLMSYVKETHKNAISAINSIPTSTYTSNGSRRPISRRRRGSIA